MQYYKIHGDNIVECERMLNYILINVNVQNIEKTFISKACIRVSVNFEYLGENHSWEVTFHPGFNSSNNQRWKVNIFDSFKKAGSFLDETPDAIITKVEGEKEEILCAIEFCSALQAGNQAWQRNGRAYSTMRTGCDYLYIVDFIKYELKSDRTRKSIRFPNPAVPFSYLNNSKKENMFGVQVYVKSEEFDKTAPLLKNFDEDILTNNEVGLYLINLLLGKDTTTYKELLMQKNLDMIEFFANTRDEKSFSANEWEKIYKGKEDILSLSKSKKWKLAKKVADKSKTGNIDAFLNLTKKYVYAIASSDLPFGVLPANHKKDFVKELVQIYPTIAENAEAILLDNEDLIICLVKGFKPGGDDNRPDRGILPLITMLTSEQQKIFTFIYGPMHKYKVEQIEHSPEEVAKNSGFWNVFLSLSDFILLDVPPIQPKKKEKEEQITPIINNILLKNNTLYKKNRTAQFPRAKIYTPLIKHNPNNIQEDDVDSVLHLLFTNLPEEVCFEGLCNPPGGDWSGLSIIEKDVEYRWLSLPRVSSSINAKRPDHVIQFIDNQEQQVLFSIESKEKSGDLEKNIGPQLKKYIDYLTNHIPSCERKIGGEWQISKNIISPSPKNIISVVAFLENPKDNYAAIFEKTKCDFIFSLKNIDNTWHLKIINCMEGSQIFNRLKKYFEQFKSMNKIQIEFSEL